MSTVCDLTDKHCVPCEGGVDPIDREAAGQYLADLPGWTLSDDAKMITRRFEFKGFFRRQGHVVRGYYKGKRPLSFNFTAANALRKYGDDWLPRARAESGGLKVDDRPVDLVALIGEAPGGRVSVQSTPGSRATFPVYLPSRGGTG